MKKILGVEQCKHLRELGFDPEGDKAELMYYCNKLKEGRTAVFAQNIRELKARMQEDLNAVGVEQALKLNDYFLRTHINAFTIGDLIEALSKHNILIRGKGVVIDTPRFYRRAFVKEQELIDNLYEAACELLTYKKV